MGPKVGEMKEPDIKAEAPSEKKEDPKTSEVPKVEEKKAEEVNVPPT